jgi:hypothetical protein
MSCVTRIDHNEIVTDPSLPSSRQAPKRPTAAIADLTLLVRVPGRPDLIQAFTAAEQAESDSYAATTGGIIDRLPT